MNKVSEINSNIVTVYRYMCVDVMYIIFYM